MAGSRPGRGKGVGSTGVTFGKRGGRVRGARALLSVVLAVGRGIRRPQAVRASALGETMALVANGGLRRR